MFIRRNHRTCALILSLAVSSSLPTYAATDGIWNINGGGSWTTPSNWFNNAIPSVAGDTATFGPVLTDPGGATVTLDGDQTVAALTFNSSAGAYTLAQGTAGTLFLRGSTTGTSSLSINVNAGQHTLSAPVDANADLTINAAGGSTLTLTGTMSSPRYTKIGGTGSSVANFTLTGTLNTGTSTYPAGVGTGLEIGSSTTPTVFTINGGNLVAGGAGQGFDTANIMVGRADGSVAAMKLVSGTIATTVGEFWLGDRSTTSGYAAFTQLGGTVTTASFFVVGNSYDRAVFNMSGGVFTSLRDPITIGAGYPYGNAIGVVNLSGGTVTSQYVWVGEIGIGVINMTQNALLNASQLQFGASAFIGSAVRNGTVNLAGGTLTAGNVVLGPSPGSTGTFNFHGGLLRASANGSFSSNVPAYVYPEGAVIDDGGFIFLVGSPLLAPTGIGVSSVAVAGGTGYIDTPIVQITNATGDTTGKGATAVANIDANGNLTGITITNPGIGYTLSPTVSILGGGGGGVLVGSVTLAPNSSGGLTKTGLGTLSLARNSTYTGTTNVMNGTLLIAGTLSGAGPVIVNGGAYLAGTGVVAGPVSVAGGAAPSAQGTINLVNGSIGTLTLNGGVIAGGSAGQSSRLGFELGATTGNADRINLGASALTVNPGGIAISLNMVDYVLPGNNYTLMTFTNALPVSNVSLATTRLELNDVSLNLSSSAIGVSITGQPTPASAYWTGAYGSVWNSIGGPSNDQSNFNTNATSGINTLQMPGPTTNVFFAADSASNLNTALGRNFAINSLTVKSGSGPVSINGTQSLTIQSGIISVENGAAGMSISTPLSLVSNQSWSNFSSAPVVISGTLTGSQITITTNGNFQIGADSAIRGSITIGSGTLQIGLGGTTGSFSNTAPLFIQGILDNGVLAIDRSDTFGFAQYINGSGSVVQLGTGTLTLQNVNDYTGATVISAGTLFIDVPPKGPIVDNSHLRLSGSNGSMVNDISGNGDVVYIPKNTGTASTLGLTGAHSYTGSTTINAPASGYNPRIVFSGTNSHSIGLVTSTFGSTSGTTTLQVAANAALTSDGVSATSWIIDGTHTVRANGSSTGTSKVNSLSIAHTGSGTNATYTGVLNLNDNKLIVQSMDPNDKATKIGDLNAAITAGSNGATWTGNGITSASAANDASHYGLGLFDNAILQKTSFGGQPTDTNSILITIAHLGDANGNGIVDIQDVSILANNWQQSRNNWAQGDLNRDGIVNIQDSSIVANNWQQTSIYSLEPSLSPYPYPLSPQSVPEPASLGILASSVLLIAPLRSRRKRR